MNTKLVSAVVGVFILGAAAFYFSSSPKVATVSETTQTTPTQQVVATSTALQASINFWQSQGGTVSLKTDSVSVSHLLSLGSQFWRFPNEPYTKYYSDLDSESATYGQLVFTNHNSSTLSVPGADLSTFVVSVMNDNYSKDKNHVYLNGQVIANADPLTFTLVPNSTTVTATDKNHSFFLGEIVK